MLPAVNRIRTSDEFVKVFRTGKKCGNALLAVHVIYEKANTKADLPKVGFVVSKNVGNSVVRHAVTRKLRHILRAMLPMLGASKIVIRVFRPAANASSAQLENAVKKNLCKLGILNKNSYSNDFNIVQNADENADEAKSK